jgi:hypothetical protein
MSIEPDPKLERLIHRELRSLPDRPAPESLLPRVMAAIRERQSLPWWARPWTSWPRGAQMVSFLLLLGVLGGLGWGWPTAWEAVGPVETVGIPDRLLSPLGTLWQGIVTLGGEAMAYLNAEGRPLLLMIGCVVLALYLFCVGLGTALVRLVLQSRPHNL